MIKNNAQIEGLENEFFEAIAVLDKKEQTILKRIRAYTIKINRIDYMDRTPNWNTLKKQKQMQEYIFDINRMNILSMEARNIKREFI